MARWERIKFKRRDKRRDRKTRPCNAPANTPLSLASFILGSSSPRLFCLLFFCLFFVTTLDAMSTQTRSLSDAATSFLPKWWHTRGHRRFYSYSVHIMCNKKSMRSKEQEDHPAAAFELQQRNHDRRSLSDDRLGKDNLDNPDIPDGANGLQLQRVNDDDSRIGCKRRNRCRGLC